MNYAELAMAIQDWSMKSSIGKVLPTIIRFGQRDLEDNLRIRAMEYHPTAAALTANTASVALPVDYLETIQMALTKDGTRYPIDGRDSVRVRYDWNMEPTQTGLPSRVIRVVDDLVFDYLLDAAYTLDWIYYRRLPVLVADQSGTIPGNSNWWSAYAEEALLMSCLNKLSMYVTGIPDSDKKKWADGALLTRDALRMNEARETTGGTLLRSAPWR